MRSGLPNGWPSRWMRGRHRHRVARRAWAPWQPATCHRRHAALSRPAPRPQGDGLEGGAPARHRRKLSSRSRAGPGPSAPMLALARFDARAGHPPDPGAMAMTTPNRDQPCRSRGISAGGFCPARSGKPCSMAIRADARTGQLLTGSFYGLPPAARADDLPRSGLSHPAPPGPANPLGVRAWARPRPVGGPARCINAITGCLGPRRKNASRASRPSRIWTRGTPRPGRGFRNLKIFVEEHPRAFLRRARGYHSS